MVVHESMRDGAALESARWWCIIAWEMVLHGCLRAGGA